MSRCDGFFLRGTALAVVLTLLLTFGQSTFSQVVPIKGQLRGPNPNPNGFRFPQAPNPGLLNNGSLQTSFNPNGNLPSQVPYAYIAGMSQDNRLVHNGVAVDTFRVITEQQGQDFNINVPAGTITNTQPTGTFTYVLAGYGANRPGYNTGTMPMMPAYSGYPGYYPAYRPSVQPTGSYFTNPITSTASTQSYLPVSTAGLLTPSTASQASGNITYGTFGGDNNPFLADKEDETPSKDEPKREKTDK